QAEALDSHVASGAAAGTLSASPSIKVPGSSAPSTATPAEIGGGREQTGPAEVAPSTPRRRRVPDPLDLPLVQETLAFLESQEFLDRLWTKDATLWRGAPTALSTRLGWLTAPAVMRT